MSTSPKLKLESFMIERPGLTFRKPVTVSQNIRWRTETGRREKKLLLSSAHFVTYINI
jgi:hypothetical protein